MLVSLGRGSEGHTAESEKARVPPHPGSLPGACSVRPPPASPLQCLGKRGELAARRKQDAKWPQNRTASHPASLPPTSGLNEAHQNLPLTRTKHKSVLIALLFRWLLSGGLAGEGEPPLPKPRASGVFQH